ncbi:MAG: beta-eliminating lyase-related protein [Gammaproteobacteria bacterium]|nr:beta-eliminating lyase-related protein [Gammaproteobacteria bacterium]
MQGSKRHRDGARGCSTAAAEGCAGAGHHGPLPISASVRLSEGLGGRGGPAPASGLAFITEARRWRKTVGGMRQAGFLAAAGIHALEYHVERLADDHRRAERLAALVNERYQGAATHYTNMVFVDLPAEELGDLGERLAADDIIIRGLAGSSGREAMMRRRVGEVARGS